jgi:ERCC4-related helicase
LYKAALEWDLTDPIVIERRADFKSEYRWRDRMEPYHHQVTNLITFCRRLPVTLLADDVGLGKTISAGLIVSELISRSRIQKILVVCPKLLGPQWKEELNAKFDIPADVATGRELLTAEPDEIGAVITTYASARLHLDAIPAERFQMLIVDEAHKLRNLYGVESPPQVARKFRKALEDRRFRYVLMLTATPIHNRLWDLYSLVDLLTVARGHENPFGSEGTFARKFIADGREQARRLKPEARDEFRSVVYGYMSRVRRGNAKLYFPQREVQMHRVEPTRGELELIQAIAKPIQKLNRLAQISILQALASSPDALLAQLKNMVRNGTVPAELAVLVSSIVAGMPLSAKLLGLQALINQLKRENHERWRLVVFTTRIETQTTIQTFLEKSGLRVGIINGASGARNQQTIAGFRSDPPAWHVIVSTEAGSEGVNLQVANVLVNYDLPWNPMIVEQRIGRIQRLGSRHAKVGIFNIILRGTFEEVIVGRLMEKLQMAAHAIGEIEALLQASGLDDDDENGVSSFDEKIRLLVIAALAGKDVELETRQAEASIAKAKTELEQEQSTINALLGEPDGKEQVGPRAPTLPSFTRSMKPREFTLLGLTTLGTRTTDSAWGTIAEENGGEEFIHFDDEVPKHPKSTLYAPGTPAFSRLVSRITATGIHDVEDLDDDPGGNSKAKANAWVKNFGAKIVSAEVTEVRRRFRGIALVRVRATVAHDSYERLVEVRCSEENASKETSRSFLAPLSNALNDPRAVGIDPRSLSATAEMDEAISEFCRFYLERRELEMQATGKDERKRKKLEDEFTPRLEASLVGLEGKVDRDVTVETKYRIDDAQYTNTLVVRPSEARIIQEPEFAACGKTAGSVPRNCLRQCQISGAWILNHLLVPSARSGRFALPEFTVVCALSGNRLLQDEVQLSDVTGLPVDKVLLKTSRISGKKAEPEHFGQCASTGTQALRTELGLSEVSGKPYRLDQQRRSINSGKTGHKDEFILCAQTGHSLLLAEAERCEITGSLVQPGLLEECAVTGKRVLPALLDRCELTGKRVLRSELDKCEATGKLVLRSELARCGITRKRVLPSQLVTCDVTGKRVLPSEIERCAASGKCVLREFLVSSSISGIRLLQEVAVRSADGAFCAPSEVGQCAWSGRACHPSDLRQCELTGLPIFFEFARLATSGYALKPLIELLDGTKKNADKPELWPILATDANGKLGKGKCSVEAAVLSPTGSRLAASIEVRTLLGFKLQHAGIVYAIEERAVLGSVVKGQRKASRWLEAQQ